MSLYYIYIYTWALQRVPISYLQVYLTTIKRYMEPAGQAGSSVLALLYLSELLHEEAFALHAPRRGQIAMRCRIILRSPKGTIILTTTHMAIPLSWGSPVEMRIFTSTPQPPRQRAAKTPKARLQDRLLNLKYGSLPTILWVLIWNYQVKYPVLDGSYRGDIEIQSALFSKGGPSFQFPCHPQVGCL